MTTISVPLTPDLEKFIKNMVKNGRANNKADAVRKALLQLAENEAVDAVLRAERELAQGLGMRGDLRELAKKI
ncbi:MAG: hypothetical protein NTV02_00450 [Candidatus Zambryskibacteria bacterium]|nr:hypothetical protein [Candidatus Zambryskibacteria bacterium]